MQWYVYIVSNRAHTLYVGAASELLKRARDHEERRRTGFTARYTFNRLVYFELASSEKDARRREREIKGWIRVKKVALIQSMNPNWRDLRYRIVRAAIDVQS